MDEIILLRSDYRLVPGVYIFTNLLNKKQYVGESMNIKDRMAHHKRDKGRIMYNAIQKYGIDNFNIEVYYLPDFKKADLIELEEKMIKRYDCLAPKGYNICSKGIDRMGYKHSEESRKKMSETFKRNYSPTKHWMFGKTGKNNHSSKKVSQYSKDGTFIKTYDSMTLAADTLKLKLANISSCCAGVKKSSGGFIWKVSNNTNDNIIIDHNGYYSGGKAVSQYSKEGELIKTFNSAAEAGRDSNICRCNIYWCCKGKRKSAGGFLWKYTDPDP